MVYLDIAQAIEVINTHRKFTNPDRDEAVAIATQLEQSMFQLGSIIERRMNAICRNATILSPEFAGAQVGFARMPGKRFPQTLKDCDPEGEP